MRSLLGLRGGLCVVVVLVLTAPSLNGEGSSSWKDSGSSYQSGIPSWTNISDGTIKLDLNTDMVANWTKMDAGSPMAAVDGYQIAPNRMVYDRSVGASVMFDYVFAWLFNSTSGTWERKNATSYPIDKSYNLVTTYDTTRNHTIFKNWAGQTFTYDASTDNWTKMRFSYDPYVPLTGAQSMAYDAGADRAIMWGGRDDDETWLYDPVLDFWYQKYPSASPSTRTGCSLAFDPGTGDTILFGGRQENDTTRRYAFFNDTWAYNVTDNNWTRKNPATSPPPLSDYTMVYDDKAGVLVVFGGVTPDGSEYRVLGETWWYNASLDTWTNMTPVFSPHPRMAHAAAYDSRKGAMILFGGKNDTARFGDTWTYDSSTNAWTNIVPMVLPRGRSYHNLVSEQQDGDVVMFGGTFWGGGGADSFTSWLGGSPNDLWFYNVRLDRWTEVRPAYGPPWRMGAAMVYDSKADRLVMFGGCSWDGEYRYANDTWSYDFSNGTWANLTPATSPPGRWLHKMTYDISNDVIVLFGGVENDNKFGDTWMFDCASEGWMQINVPTGPSPDSWHSMAYDEESSKIMLASLMDGCLWGFDAVKKTWDKGSAFPQDFHPTAMDYDNGNGTLVMFSGDDSGLMFYDTDNSTFIPGKGPMQWANEGIGFSYEKGTDTIVLFGGHSNRGAAGASYDETWVYNLHRFRGAGEFDSMQFDTGGPAHFGNLRWNGSTPEITAIRFQFRSGSTQDELNLTQFTGPDGTNGTFYTSSGQAVSSIQNGSRWMQYRAFLHTDDRTVTPILHSVTVDYNLMQDVRLTSPAGGEYWSGLQNITWSASDPDNDTLSFDIFLENSTGSILLASELPNGTSAWSWNTTSIQNGTYRIRISAADNNPFIPLTVNATSGNFTIYHPPPPQPPNRLHHVDLVSPPNNSVVNRTNVLLEWNGTDADDDPLMYTVLFSDHPLEDGPATLFQTGNQSLDIGGLADNKTYYWTVLPDDARSSLPPEPVPVWSFTVRLPPVVPPPENHPPRITSNPKTTVTAGETYEYNVTAVDDDFDVVTFAILDAPANMTIDNITGRLRWPTGLADVGNRSVTVRVADTAGATGNQTFKISVLEPPRPPQRPSCAITSPANGSKVSGRVFVRGTALNGSLPITVVQVRLDGGEWRTAIGLGNWSITLDLAKSANGKHTIEARSFDGSLYSDTATVQIAVSNREPVTTMHEPPWPFVALIILMAAGAGILLVRRKKWS